MASRVVTDGLCGASRLGYGPITQLWRSQPSRALVMCLVTIQIQRMSMR